MAVPAEEYERRPVPEHAQKDGKSFWGMYASEHTAGTEFMIGPLFVALGVGAWDLIWGLFLGNLAAVLTWRYLTTPIALRCRLTLYYKLEKICGRRLVVGYNLLNGLLFCFLAGAMITVSATAVGVPFEAVRMPTFNDTLPTGFEWCIVVIAIGAAMTLVAVRGYSGVARIGHIAAPWMFLIFAACGIVMMARLQTTDLIALLEPAPGTPEIVGFWGVFFFAWFCNAAMHLGMADLSVLRYARKARHGWAPAAGMYLGHFVAWICAALLLVYWVRAFGTDPRVGEAPGLMVYDAVGWAGLVCVVIAGWTTANPTLYRAGLAFQGVAPRLRRSTATLIAGGICTIAGLFPFFSMKLLGFVGIYGMLLAPVGAIIAVDVLLAHRLGLPTNPAEQKGSSLNLAALMAWIIPAGIGLWTISALQLPLPTYATLPVWLGSGLLYILLLKVFK